MEKVKFTRAGVTRSFSAQHIKQFSGGKGAKPWPESEGWVRVPEEVEQMNAKLKLEEGAEGGVPAGAVAGEAVTSSDFKASADDIKNIEAHVAGYSPEQLAAFFDGETRKSLQMNAKLKLEEGAEGGVPAGAVAGEAVTSSDFKASADDIKNIEAHVAGYSPEQLAAFFDGETRKSLLELYEKLKG